GGGRRGREEGGAAGAALHPPAKIPADRAGTDDQNSQGPPPSSVATAAYPDGNLHMHLSGETTTPRRSAGRPREGPSGGPAKRPRATGSASASGRAPTRGKPPPAWPPRPR